MTLTPTAGLTGLRWTVLDAMTIGRRNLLRYLRVPQLLVFSSVQPVMFILLFNYVFGGAIRGIQAPKYIDFLVPGILAQTVLFGTVNTGMGLAEDLKGGMIDRYRSLPMARSAVLAGRTLSDLIRSAFILTLLLGVGFLIGFRPQTDLAGVLGALAVGLAFGYAWSWVMATVGLLVRTTESIQAAVYLVIFPLAFASGVFVPTETMPAWLQVFTEHQPVSVVTSALRGLILGAGALSAGQTVSGQVALALLWSAAIMAVFAPLAVQLYRRSASGDRQR